MRVALIATHFAEYAARLALALAERHAIQLHLSRPNAEAELTPPLRGRLERAVALHVHDAPVRRRCLAQGAAFARTVRAFRPDVVHAQEHAPWTLWAARFLGLGGPLVLTVHDPRPHSGADAARARGTLPIARLRAGADAIVVHGAALIADVAGRRVRVVPHGALGERTARALPPRPGHLLFLGRIEAYKGLDVLLDAAALLIRDGVDVTLTIAGRGSDLDRHRDRIAAMAPRVRLDERHVPADELPGILGAASAVVMPYRDATQSGIASLAFNAGRAVVASRVGALPELVQDGVNGLLVPPGDAPALGAALRRLILDPALADRLGRGAAASADGPLAWASVARRTEAIYAEVLAAQASCSPRAAKASRSATPASETSAIPPSPR